MQWSPECENLSVPLFQAAIDFDVLLRPGQRLNGRMHCLILPLSLSA